MYDLTSDEMEFIQKITIRCQAKGFDITVDQQIQAMREEKEFMVYGDSDDYYRMLDLAQKLKAG